MSVLPRRGLASESTQAPRKPRRLHPGDNVAVISPASPADAARLQAGIVELKRLGFDISASPELKGDGYFAGSLQQRRGDFSAALADNKVAGLIAVRGGYGANYLLDSLPVSGSTRPVCLIGYSDLTSVQILLWQRFGWVSFYGPMVAAGFDAGAGKPRGYDEASLLRAVREIAAGWSLDLQGEAMLAGEAEGILLGGCLTLVQTSVGTPWQLDAHGAILILEDRAMKPWQVDRALMHLKQAGLFSDIRGLILGDFPECAPGVPGSWTVADVCRRLLEPLGVPVVWGVPVGHTDRPMLTLPLGVRARLRAQGAGTLEILEPAVVE
jgi:muramoyltetrapeptide carboxypeptidase